MLDILLGFWITFQAKLGAVILFDSSLHIPMPKRSSGKERDKILGLISGVGEVFLS